MPAVKKAATRTTKAAPTKAGAAPAIRKAGSTPASAPAPTPSRPASPPAAFTPVPTTPRWEEIPSAPASTAWTASFSPAPTRPLATWMAVALGATMLLNLTLLGLDVFGDGPTALRLLLSIVQGAASLAAIVLVCLWTHRVLSNARGRAPDANIRPGWAVGSFFVPFVQFVAPGLEVAKGWRADTGRGAGPVAAWFVPWGLAQALMVVTAVVLMGSMLSAIVKLDVDPDDPAFDDEMQRIQDEAQDDLGPWLMAGNGMQLVAGVALILLGLRWSRLQDGAAGPPALAARA